MAAELVPGETLVDTLLERARDYHPTAADREFAETGVRRIVARGNGAIRQRRAFARAGIPGLMDMATQAMTADPRA